MLKFLQRSGRIQEKLMGAGGVIYLSWKSWPQAILLLLSIKEQEHESDPFYHRKISSNHSEKKQLVKEKKIPRSISNLILACVSQTTKALKIELFVADEK